MLGGRLLASLQAEGVTGDTESDGSKQSVLYGAITGALEYSVLEHFVVRGGLSWLPHGGVGLSRVEPWSDQANQLEVEDDTRYMLSLRMLL